MDFAFSAGAGKGSYKLQTTADPTPFPRPFRARPIRLWVSAFGPRQVFCFLDWAALGEVAEVLMNFWQTTTQCKVLEKPIVVPSGQWQPQRDI